ncbi:MAG: DUF2259 domain-containing protein [Pseudomonadota bacterium]
MRFVNTLFVGLIAAPCVFADIAELEILGFSDHGKVFVFQQSGTTGGAGFSYSERHYIYTENSRHVLGSPVFLEDTTGRKSPHQVSRDLLKILTKKQSTFSLTAHDTVAVRLSTDVSSDPNTLSFYLSEGAILRGEAPYTVSINPMPASKANDCAPFEEVSLGLTLTQRSSLPATTRSTRTVFQPLKHWGCVLHFQVSGAYLFQIEDVPLALGVIVRVRLRGFEGPKIRWMGLGFKL